MVDEMSLRIPAEHLGGSFANIVSVWHTPYDFCLDFGAIVQPEHPDEGNVEVTSRVRVPPAALPEMVRVLQASLAAYQLRFGPITEPTRADVGWIDPAIFQQS